MNRRPAPDAAPFSADPHRGGQSLRVNPYRSAHLAFGPELVPAEEAPDWKGRWRERLGGGPLNLELGIGDGRWLATSAARTPDAAWLGVEIRYKRCTQGAGKLRAAVYGADAPRNAAVVRYSWFDLRSIFAPGEIAVMHIQHPDPWERGKQAKHRLIEPGFVALTAELIEAGGELRLKTDFRPHFDALLAAIVGGPWDLLGVSVDIRRDGAPWEDDIVTGYQQKFDGRGLPVFGVRVRRV